MHDSRGTWVSSDMHRPPHQFCISQPCTQVFCTAPIAFRSCLLLVVPVTSGHCQVSPPPALAGKPRAISLRRLRGKFRELESVQHDSAGLKELELSKDSWMPKAYARAWSFKQLARDLVPVRAFWWRNRQGFQLAIKKIRGGWCEIGLTHATCDNLVRQECLPGELPEEAAPRMACTHAHAHKQTRPLSGRKVLEC